MIQDIYKKISRDERIHCEDIRFLFEKASNADLQTMSQIIRNKHHREKHATYLLMSIINYTNICVAGCDYCSFYAFPHEKSGYLLTFQEIEEKIKKLCDFGGELISFNGGFNPNLKLQDYATLFEKIHKKYPQLTFFEMTVAEFVFACKVSKISFQEGARILKNAGTQWVTGGGAEILDNNFRKRHSPGKGSSEEYFEAQACILDAHIGSTATMVIGFDESLDERLNHLEQLRKFQDQSSNGLMSFLCWVYKPYNNKLGGKEISSEEYLRWLAICRIYLDNFKNIRLSVLTKNKEALRGLKYGANDFDIPLEDEVTQKAGAVIDKNVEAILKACKDIGFEPEQRAPFIH